MMYIKLIWRNARRSFNDYLIYMVTLTLCVTMFYSFLSISSQYYQPDIGVEYNLDIVSDGMKLAVFTLTLLLLVLIQYVNRFMIRRRQKEFAVQTIMGMEQRVTAWLFFGETLIMGLCSLVLGILAGAVCSQFITAMLMNAFGKEYRFTWLLFPDTIGITVVFFLLCFVLTGFFQVRIIRKIKIIDMLKAQRKNEEKVTKSRWIYVLAGINFAVQTGLTTHGIRQMYYYFDRRYSWVLHVVYWSGILVPGACVLLWMVWFFQRKKRNFLKTLGLQMFLTFLSVVLYASLPVMKMKFLMPIAAEAFNFYMLSLIWDLIFFIGSFFYLIGRAIAALKEKSMKLRYKGENLFYFGQVLSRLKSTTATLTLISITLMASVILFLLVPFLVGWAEGYLHMRSVYDIEISSTYHDIAEVSELQIEEYDCVDSFLKEHDVFVKDDCIFSTYLPRRGDFSNRNKYGFPETAISLSDYNHLCRILGAEEISLKEGEFAVQYQENSREENLPEVLKNQTRLETDGGTLSLKPGGIYHRSMGEAVYNLYTDYLYVLPDKICGQLLEVSGFRVIQTEKPLPFDVAVELEKMFYHQYPEAEESMHFDLDSNTKEAGVITGYNFVLQAGMTYGAVVLLVICFTILSLLQLSDAGQYAFRFQVLRNLGVERKRIHSLILKQLGLWFGLPVGMAVLVSGIFSAYLFLAYQTEIRAYIGFLTLFGQVAAVFAVMALIFLCYFVATWILFKRTVKE